MQWTFWKFIIALSTFWKFNGTSCRSKIFWKMILICNCPFLRYVHWKWSPFVDTFAANISILVQHGTTLFVARYITPQQKLLCSEPKKGAYCVFLQYQIRYDNQICLNHTSIVWIFISVWTSSSSSNFISSKLYKTWQCDIQNYHTFEVIHVYSYIYIYIFMNIIFQKFAGGNQRSNSAHRAGSPDLRW